MEEERDRLPAFLRSRRPELQVAEIYKQGAEIRALRLNFSRNASFGGYRIKLTLPR